MGKWYTMKTYWQGKASAVSLYNGTTKTKGGWSYPFQDILRNACTDSDIPIQEDHKIPPTQRQ